MEEANLALMGNAGGGGRGGGRVSSGGSTSLSMSTEPLKDCHLVLTSEESSSYPDESELDLGLGLSLSGGGGGGAVKSKSAVTPASAPWGQYARIFTAKDLPSMGSNSSSAKSPSSLSSSSSSSSSMTKVNVWAGTKRTADSDSPPTNGGVSQVVGWPPIRAYRMNSLLNQAKSRATEEFHSTFEKSKSKNSVIDMNSSSGSVEDNNNVKEKEKPKTSMFVKVNMDGMPIGRKVNLNAHNCYETLSQTLEDMFGRPTTNIGSRRSSIEKHEATGFSKLLDGSSEFVLTYEDKEGDWMLVGDVPWGLFLSSVKRLRITRTSEPNGLRPSFQVRNGRQSTTI